MRQYQSTRGLIFECVSTIDALPHGPGIMIMAKLEHTNRWRPLIVKAVDDLQVQKCIPRVFWTAALLRGMTHVHYLQTDNVAMAVELANAVCKFYRVDLVYW